MMTHVEKLRTELNDVKKKLSYQVPEPNMWPNFALESNGTIYRIDLFQL